MVTQRSQGWIDGCEDGAAIPSRQQEICDGGDDADVGLGPDLLERDTDGPVPDVVDDLGALHGLAGAHIKGRHVPPNVTIAYDGVEPTLSHS